MAFYRDLLPLKNVAADNIEKLFNELCRAEFGFELDADLVAELDAVLDQEVAQ
jgi:hypothetical protein